LRYNIPFLKSAVWTCSNSLREKIFFARHSGVIPAARKFKELSNKKDQNSAPVSTSTSDKVVEALKTGWVGYAVSLTLSFGTVIAYNAINPSRYYYSNGAGELLATPQPAYKKPEVVQAKVAEPVQEQTPDLPYEADRTKPVRVHWHDEPVKAKAESDVFNNRNYPAMVLAGERKDDKYRSFDIKPVLPTFFSGKGNDGKEWSLEAIMKDHEYVVVQFTDRYCGPCKDLIPDYEHFNETTSDKLKFVSLVYADDENWQHYLRENPVGYLLVHDKDGKNFEENGFNIVPSMYLAHKIKENGEDVLKVVSVCRGGGSYARDWLSHVKAAVSMTEFYRSHYDSKDK